MPPITAAWVELDGQVTHTFTHFHLVLTVHHAKTNANPTRGEFTPWGAFNPGDLPTLMRKAYDLASAQLLNR